MSTDSADATASWLYEAVIRYLQGPMYTTPLMGFIDAKCLVFDDEEENKLEFTVVHNEFKDLVEGLLSDFLNELGVTPERFVDVVERANAERELGDFVASSILTVDDFLQFKAMMVRRNRDLTKEVLEAHGMATDGSSSTARAVTDADNDASATPRRNADKNTAEAAEDDGDSRRRATESSATPPMSPDSVYLAKAMRESAAQFENEQREIERAIEQTRLAREQERAAEEEAAKRLAAEREDATRRAEEEDAAEADEEEEEDVAVDDVALRRALKMSSAQFALDAVAKSERERREKILEEHERAAIAESEREARRNAPVPEFEEERVTSADDGFDAGAVEQAVAMSVLQLEKDRAAAAAKAEAELEKKRLEKEREEEMERAADAALRADVQTALERSVGVAAEEAAAFERERLELERALSLSLEAEEVAKKELVDAIERDTFEASSEASLEETAALQPEQKPAGVDAAQPAEAEAESTDVSNAASPRRRDGVVDRLTEQTKVPLGAESAPDASECLAAKDKNVINGGAKSLASLLSVPPLTRVGALRGAGYRKTKAFTVSSVPETDGATFTSEEQKRHAVREAAVAAAAAQKALVIEKQLDLKRRADAAAARAALAAAEATAAAAAAAGLEDAATLERKRRFMAEQRGMLVARKAAERQRELAAHEARTHASVVAAAAEKSKSAAGDPKEKENVSAFPAVGKAVAFPVGAVLSEEQQRQKREALRTELARRMKSGLAARNAWGETETYV